MTFWAYCVIFQPYLNYKKNNNNALNRKCDYWKEMILRFDFTLYVCWNYNFLGFHLIGPPLQALTQITTKKNWMLFWSKLSRTERLRMESSQPHRQRCWPFGNYLTLSFWVLFAPQICLKKSRKKYLNWCFLRGLLS